eukprot:SAG31_NODE_4563_length_3135_cov_6.260359_1_plen_55_part_00
MTTLTADLRELADLSATGVLTAEEFAQAKAALIAATANVGNDRAIEALSPKAGM